jgi:superkiller protein 3
MRALARGPNLIEAHHNLAIDYIHTGQFEKAISAWKEIVSLFPGIAGVHFNLGIAYRKMGRLHEAIYEYRKAVEIKPNHANRIAEALRYPVHPNLKGLFRRMFKRAS